MQNLVVIGKMHLNHVVTVKHNVVTVKHNVTGTSAQK